MVPQNSHLKPHRLQAPTAFFGRPHPTLYQTYKMHSRMTFNMTLSTQLLSRTFFFSPLATLYIMWDLFFFNVNYLFFNCFTELCWFLPNINSMWDLSSLVRDLTCTPAVEPWSPNHWIIREVPVWVFVILLLKLLAFTLLISSTTNSDFCITVQAQGVFFFFCNVSKPCLQMTFNSNVI